MCVLAHMLRLHRVQETEGKVTELEPDQPAPPVPEAGTRACGMQLPLTENSVVNTNVFKMADSE